MAKSKKVIGRVITPGDVNVWPHEDLTAKSLAVAGFEVEFIRKSHRKGENSADCLMNGEKWEMKAPRSAKLSAIEDNLKKASKQANQVIFDSRRMHHIPDSAIKRELITKSHNNKSIIHLKFVNRHGKVVDIK
ncbi:MAG: hypothetical protein LBL08_00295 [Candidatus Nomurabacteria bacterium]|jgi:hypothetical protein|nr:hypothetical protein [Candidatus Nomurabacteria bacterium]